jgi:hypothetical protein
MSQEIQLPEIVRLDLTKREALFCVSLMEERFHWNRRIFFLGPQRLIKINEPIRQEYLVGLLNASSIAGNWTFGMMPI